jgi:hypothetical protein
LRNWDDLLQMVPGVAGDRYTEQGGSTAAGRTGGVNVHGVRPLQNNFLLDGVDNNTFSATIPKLAATEIVLSATVSRAAGQQIQWIRNGQVMSTVPADNGRRVLLPAQAHPGDWFSLILRDRKGPTVFSNAIYIE